MTVRATEQGRKTGRDARAGLVVRHPEHAHLFGAVRSELASRGHAARVLVREHGPTTALLDAAGVAHEVLAGEAGSLPGLVGGHLVFEARLARVARARDLDVLVSVGGRAVSHVAPLVGARSVVCVDWRPGRTDRVVGRLADAVCSPTFADVDSAFENRIEYDGYHELAYLHPDRFEPSPDAVRDLGVDPDDRIAVVGFGDATPVHVVDRTVERLAECTRVVRSHESTARGALGDLTVVPATRAHDVLAHAAVYAGDSGTMATETAVLGTPAVRLRPGGPPEPRCADLERRYGLVHATADPAGVPDAAVDLATDDLTDWAGRRDQLVAETGDAATVIADAIEEVSG